MSNLVVISVLVASLVSQTARPEHAAPAATGRRAPAPRTPATLTQLLGSILFAEREAANKELFEMAQNPTPALEAALAAAARSPDAEVARRARILVDDVAKAKSWGETMRRVKSAIGEAPEAGRLGDLARRIHEARSETWPALVKVLKALERLQGEARLPLEKERNVLIRAILTKAGIRDIGFDDFYGKATGVFAGERYELGVVFDDVIVACPYPRAVEVPVPIQRYLPASARAALGARTLPPLILQTAIGTYHPSEGRGLYLKTFIDEAMRKYVAQNLPGERANLARAIDGGEFQFNRVMIQP